MDEEGMLKDANCFTKLVAELRKEGLSDAPSFNEALLRIKRRNRPELERWIREYPSRDQFESLLFLYWKN